MSKSIVNQTPAVVNDLSESNVERIAYRPKGRIHPEQWVATVDGRRCDVTPASARLVLDVARDMRMAGDEYRQMYQLRRWPATDGGRAWWVYEFVGVNDLAAHLVEAQ